MSRESIANLGMTKSKFEKTAGAPSARDQGGARSRQAITSAREPGSEQQLFLHYLQQHEDVVTSLGISLPDTLKTALISLPWRRVEIRPIYEAGDRPITPVAPVQPTPQKGRYQKSSTAGNNNQRFLSRRSFVETGQKQVPENRRPLMQVSAGRANHRRLHRNWIVRDRERD